MNTITSPSGNQHTDSAPGDGRRSGPVGFFRYHGIWAPGVRLFRRMGFANKALCISAVFMVPIAMLTWSLLSDAKTSLDSTARERHGTQYNRETLAMLRAALAHQWAAAQAAGKAPGAPAVDEVRARADAQFKKLQETDKALGAELATADAFKAVVEAAAPLAQPAGSASAVYAKHAEFVDALLDLAAEVTDASGLVLDPDLDSYYLMSAAVGDGPDMLAQLGRLRGVGTDALAAQAITPGQARSLTRGQPLAARRLGDIKAAIAKLAGANAPAAAAINLAETIKLVEGFMAQVEAAPLAAEGPKGDAAAFATLGTQAIDGLGEAMARGVNQLDTLLAARMKGIETRRNVIMLALALSLLGAGYLFRSFYMVLNGGLNEVERHITAISKGDLTTIPRPWGKDEAARLMLTIQALQESLCVIVGKVRNSASSVVHASGEVASGAADLSQRTEQAAANLEQTASAMEQLSSTVRQTAENAAQASQLASGNAEVAERGGHVIGQVVTTMEGIHASSSKIGEIIGTIDGIAFQTNILALNAAVEAARAGEQGRGFAVVATEVRALAQRSAAAAREIKTLISNSVDQVASGTVIVQGAGRTMQELVVNARRMNELVAEISTAAREQSTGIGEVGKAVQEMDRMTQQNAALVEQTTAAASSLNDQAAQLIGEVGQFTLPNAGAAARD